EPEWFGLGELREFIAHGASPRASLGLVAAGRALALLRDRTYVLPQDVFDVAPDVLRHRLVSSHEALARDVSIEEVLGRLLSTVPAPPLGPARESVTPPPPNPPIDAVRAASTSTPPSNSAPASESDPWRPEP